MRVSADADEGLIALASGEHMEQGRRVAAFFRQVGHWLRDFLDYGIKELLCTNRSVHVGATSEVGGSSCYTNR
jgi:hypothetical protein